MGNYYLSCVTTRPNRCIGITRLLCIEKKQGQIFVFYTTCMNGTKNGTTWTPLICKRRWYEQNGDFYLLALDDNCSIDDIESKQGGGFILVQGKMPVETVLFYKTIWLHVWVGDTGGPTIVLDGDNRCTGKAEWAVLSANTALECGSVPTAWKLSISLAIKYLLSSSINTKPYTQMQIQTEQNPLKAIYPANGVCFSWQHCVIARVSCWL